MTKYTKNQAAEAMGTSREAVVLSFDPEQRIMTWLNLQTGQRLLALDHAKQNQQTEKATRFHYNGYEFSPQDVQEMIANKLCYKDADNLPKWMAIDLAKAEGCAVEVAFLATWAFLTTFSKL